MDNLTLFDYLQVNKEFSQFDLAHLADWADGQYDECVNPKWAEAYHLLSSGADLLNRRISMSSDTPPIPQKTGKS